MCLLVAANHQPVAGGRVFQHGVGDRDVVLHFTGLRQALSDCGSLAPSFGVGGCGSLAALGCSVLRRLAVAERPDGGVVIRGERRLAGCGSVAIENIGRDGEIGGFAEAVGCCRRHRGLDEGMELRDRASSPVRHERGAGEGGGVAATGEGRQVAGGAVGFVRLFALRDLGGGERPCGSCGLLGGEVARKEDGGGATERGQGHGNCLIHLHGQSPLRQQEAPQVAFGAGLGVDLDIEFAGFE